MTDSHSRRRAKGEACQYCFEKKRRCQFPDENFVTCHLCSKSGHVCTPRKPTSRTQKKRRNEYACNTHRRNSTQSFRITSPVANRLADTSEDTQLLLSETASSSGNCGICHNSTRSSGEKKSDALMLQCDAKACTAWYHLSCIQWTKRERPILLSLKTGPDNFEFICEKCLGECPEIYTDEVTEAIKHLESTIDSIKYRVRNDLDTTQEGTGCEPLAVGKHETPLIPKVHGFENGPGMQPFPLTRDQKFHGFDENTITVLLRDLSQLIYHYDRQVYWMMDTLHDDPTNTYIEAPLKEWHKLDPGCEITKGREWFELEDYTYTDTASHLPITAALRLLLKTTLSQSLAIHPNLEKVTFSQVHMSLIYWFIFDVIQNKRDIYEIPNMKPLRAMMSAVTNFGDARWGRMGQQVLREIQLRTWQKDMFKDALVENAELQTDLIKRFEAFLHPLLGMNIDIPLKSICRAAIITKTIELWSYLQAVGGELTLSHPDIGDDFDEAVHSELNSDDEQGDGLDHREISWVLCQGFCLKEDSSDGSSRQLTIKALVVT